MYLERSIKPLVVALLVLGLCQPLLAEGSSKPQELIKALEKLIGEEKPNLVNFKIQRTRLKDQLEALKPGESANQETKDLYSKAKAVVEEANQKIKKIEEPDTFSFRKATKPMTAVLLSNQERNTFEVVKNPSSQDDTIGVINQSQSGSTGGILLAYEALFARPRIKSGLYKADSDLKSRMPIGAWFGVNLKTGDNEDVSDVALAAGFSFSFVSASRQAKKADEEGEFEGSARLLLGVVYGEVATLGSKNAGSKFQVGDPFPLGEAPPINKDKEISFAIGLGFRF